MVPFRVFDRENKEMWVVLNYHANSGGDGSYLVAREDDSDRDGELVIIPATQIAKYRLVDFLEEDSSYDD
jgi:hypothetical protein